MIGIIASGPFIYQYDYVTFLLGFESSGGLHEVNLTIFITTQVNIWGNIKKWVNALKPILFKDNATMPPKYAPKCAPNAIALFLFLLFFKHF